MRLVISPGCSTSWSDDCSANTAEGVLSSAVTEQSSVSSADVQLRMSYCFFIADCSFTHPNARTGEDPMTHWRSVPPSTLPHLPAFCIRNDDRGSYG